MPAITLKNVPLALYRRLRRQAVDHHRSLNREAILCLERSLGAHEMDPEAFLVRLDALHARMKPSGITGAEIREAIRTGRP